MTEGQRNIPVSYARQTRGTTAFGALQTYLPLRVNQAGVIPIILQFLLCSFLRWLRSFCWVVHHMVGGHCKCCLRSF